MDLFNLLFLAVALLCESGKPIRVSSIATKSGLSLQRTAEGHRALADKARERSDKGGVGSYNLTTSQPHNPKPEVKEFRS